MKHNKNGFTLVEVIAVLVITVMAAVIAVPNVIGYVTRNKTQNCTLAIESLLSEVQTTCAVERYGSPIGVSSDIISAVSKFDDSVKGTPATTFELKLKNFCDDKNTVYVSWNIKEVKSEENPDSELLGYSVDITTKCQDGNVGTNSFECGYKENPVDSERVTIVEMIGDILNNENIKGSYKDSGKDIDDLVLKLYEITKIDTGKFNAVKECVDALTTDAISKKNLTLSMCLTVVINEKEICKNKFYKAYNSAGYMPIVAYTGGLGDNIYEAEGNDTAVMGEGGFVVFGLRSARLDDYLSVDNINANFKNGSDIAFKANCVWSEDYSEAYFLKDPSAVKTVKDLLSDLKSGNSTDLAK